MGYISITDTRWFEQLKTLSHRGRVDEVDLWTPKTWGGRVLHARTRPGSVVQAQEVRTTCTTTVFT